MSYFRFIQKVLNEKHPKLNQLSLDPLVFKNVLNDQVYCTLSTLRWLSYI